MPFTTGVVQQLKVDVQYNTAIALIGADPADSAVYSVLFDPADPPAMATYKSTMVDALSAALVTRREVTVTYADGSSEITSITL